MAKKSVREPIPDFSEVHVRLKPVFGLRPGTYLTVLYAVLFLAIAFLILVLPGMVSAGTYYELSTVPSGAAVHVDGTYIGSTPGEFLIKRGERRIELRKPFYRTAELFEQVQGRVFATLFVPPRKEVQLDLAVQDIEGLLIHAMEDFASTPYIPQILTETARVGQIHPEYQFSLYSFLNRAKYFVSSSEQMNAYLQALSFLDPEGEAMDAVSFLEFVQKNVQFQDNYENAPYWLAIILPDDRSRELTASTAFQEHHRRFLQALRAGFSAGAATSSPADAPVTVAGITFRAVPGGTLVQGRDDEPSFWESRIDPLLPHPVRIPAFRMAETEVTNRQYTDFLAENPQWRKANLAELLVDGLATEDYLASWDGDRYPDGADGLPVTGVSYYAAEAFAHWLDAKAAGRLPGYRARLPYESEWEWAARGGQAGQPYPTGRTPAGARIKAEGVEGPARVGTSEANGYGLRDMIGNVWEWCLDWYSPVSYFFTSLDAAKNSYSSAESIPIGSEKVVRGGSWANEKEFVKVYIRGSQPPAWSSAYLGFRVVLARP